MGRARAPAVQALDLHALVCPGGTYRDSVAGVDDMRADGIHFSPGGRRLVDRWLAPFVVGAAGP